MSIYSRFFDQVCTALPDEDCSPIAAVLHDVEHSDGRFVVYDHMREVIARTDLPARTRLRILRDMARKVCGP
jgi:hypothetical protein